MRDLTYYMEKYAHLRAALRAEDTAGEDAAEAPLLTDRQRQVLAAVAGGLSNPEVAAAQHCAPSTVKTTLQNASDRLGARTRAHAVALAAHRAAIDVAALPPATNPLVQPAELDAAEVELLAAIAAGTRDPVLAEQTGLSARGVSHRVGLILDRLGARDRVHAIAICYRAGLRLLDRKATR